MKRAIVLFALMGCVSFCYAKPVDKNKALKAAERFLALRYCAPAAKSVSMMTTKRQSFLKAKNVSSLMVSGKLVGYAIDLEPAGYVLFSSDDETPPIKMYSDNGCFEKLPEGLKRVIELELLEDNNSVSENENCDVLKTQEFVAQWNWLGSEAIEYDANSLAAYDASGTALMTTAWNQGDPYNYYAPLADQGPGGRALAGCLGVALAQILRYHEQPAAVALNLNYSDSWGSCTGTRSMYEAGLGPYDWANMPDTISDSSSEAEKRAIGQLIHHCGVAFEVDYEAGLTAGPITFPRSVSLLLEGYFTYTCDDYVFRSAYSDSQWYSKIKTDIDNRRPILYVFYASDGSGGHAVVCDGYRSTNEIHLNFGWGGAATAWYNIDKVVAGGSAWVDHSAAFNIVPEFLISASAGANGTVSPNSSVLKAQGESQTFTAKPSAGYIVANWTVDGQSVQSGGTIFTLSNITGDHTITVSFKQLTNTDGMFGRFDAKSNVKLTVKDSNGTNVTLSLSGPGYGQIDPCSVGLGQIQVFDTTEKSVLRISSKTKASVGDIIVNGPLKSIVAKKADVRGDITIKGSLGGITVNNVADGHTISIGQSANPKKAGAKMKFNQVYELAINSQSPIKSVSAAKWAGGSIVAPSIGSITVKGNKKQGIPGDLDADIMADGIIRNVRVAGTLSGSLDCDIVKRITAANIDTADLTVSNEPDAKVPALGRLTVKNWVTSSRILSAGNIGTISAGGLINSNCFAGITSTKDDNADDVFDLPDANAGDFVDEALIKSIRIKSLKDPSGLPCYCVVNSNIAASHILSVSLAYPKNDNGGIPFGLAGDFIKSLKIKDAQGTASWKNLDLPGDCLQFTDAEIRLH
jgi:hypothetical protein